MEISGKVVAVTGGANGIGEALCRRFAQEGAEMVAVIDLEEDRAKVVAGEIGGVGFGCDVGDKAQVDAVIREIEEKTGRIDLFFSNAGVGSAEGPEGLLNPNSTPEAWQMCWDVNVMGHVYASQAVLPGMIERGEGYLCSTASAAGLLNQIGSAPYGVTKHAAVGLAENLSIMYGDAGIRVSVLCPQAVRTRMLGDANENEDGGVQGGDGVLSPEEVAECCIAAIRDETFLILPHEEVLTYMQRKTNDYDRWLGGMRRWKSKFMG